MVLVSSTFIASKMCTKKPNSNNKFHSRLEERKETNKTTVFYLVEEHRITQKGSFIVCRCAQLFSSIDQTPALIHVVSNISILKLYYHILQVLYFTSLDKRVKQFLQARQCFWLIVIFVISCSRASCRICCKSYDCFF